MASLKYLFVYFKYLHFSVQMLVNLHEIICKSETFCLNLHLISKTSHVEFFVDLIVKTQIKRILYMKA